MIRALTTAGSHISIIASALAILSGQSLLAALAAAVGVWGLYFEHKPSKQTNIDPDKPIPSVDALKKFRDEHPRTLFHRSGICTSEERKIDFPTT